MSLSYSYVPKRPTRNTKIGRTVAHPTGNNALQFQGQRWSTKTRIADRRRHQANFAVFDVLLAVDMCI